MEFSPTSRPRSSFLGLGNGRMFSAIPTSCLSKCKKVLPLEEGHLIWPKRLLTRPVGLSYSRPWSFSQVKYKGEYHHCSDQQLECFHHC
ncbi:hypothetical protein Leryth_021788 [Lithospermum erythrorhizon]|nr:hypothetical protein Leryth_021788 [Lithospermum erythrorhizon]